MPGASRQSCQATGATAACAGAANAPAASAAARTRLAVALEEREDALPRVLGGLGELLLLAVEEAVGRAIVGNDLVLDPRVTQRLLELGDVVERDRLVGAGHQREDRAGQLACALDGAR